MVMEEEEEAEHWRQIPSQKEDVKKLLELLTIGLPL